MCSTLCLAAAGERASRTDLPSMRPPSSPWQHRACSGTAPVRQHVGVVTSGTHAGHLCCRQQGPGHHLPRGQAAQPQDEGAASALFCKISCWPMVGGCTDAGPLPPVRGLFACIMWLDPGSAQCVRASARAPRVHRPRAAYCPIHAWNLLRSSGMTGHPPQLQAPAISL